MVEVVEANSHSEWPSRGLSNGTPDPNRLVCFGIRGEGWARYAVEQTKAHPDHLDFDLNRDIVEMPAEATWHNTRQDLAAHGFFGGRRKLGIGGDRSAASIREARSELIL